jgi:hypothetical protein
MHGTIYVSKRAKCAYPLPRVSDADLFNGVVKIQRTMS